MQIPSTKTNGLIPICSWCKKVRDARGIWRRMEGQVYERSQFKLTHGICPSCRQSLFRTEIFGR